MTTIEKVAKNRALHIAKMFGRAIKGPQKLRGFASEGHSAPLRAITSRKKELKKAFKATGREAKRVIKKNPVKSALAVGAVGAGAGAL